MSKVVLKKSSVVGKVPTTLDLDFGELALNYADGRLYFKKSDGTTIDYFSTSAGGTGGGGSITVSATPPANPSVGDQWVNSTTSIKYTYINDGDSQQWVELETNVNIVNGIAFSGSYLDLTDKPTLFSGNYSDLTNKPTIPSDISQLTDSTNLLSSGFTLTGTTTDATETEIFINGVSGSRIVVPNNKMLAYTIDIACKRTDAPGDHGYWSVKGVISNTSNVATDIGSLYEVIVVRSDLLTSIDVRATNANSLGVFVTGSASKTFSWKATVSFVEV